MDAATKQKPSKPVSQSKAIEWTAGVVFALSLLAGLVVLLKALCVRPLGPEWLLQVAVFIAVAGIPHWMVDGISWLAETATAPKLPDDDKKHGFQNAGAFVGVIERPLYLAALISNQAAFIGVWFVFKGIAGYRIASDKKGRKARRAERRRFQLFLLSNAVSLGGAALGWLVWKLLPHLPTCT